MRNSVASCPHCGNTTKHDVLSEVSTHEPLIDEGGELIDTFVNEYYLVKCSTCDQVSLFHYWELSDNPSGVLSYATLLFPHNKRFGDEVPAAVRTTFFEAKKVKRLSPISFAILARKTLEIICEDKGAKGRNLKEKLEYLTASKVLPDTLKIISEAVRYFGNEGAHSDHAITSRQVEILDDLVDVIIEYVYIVPSKILKLRDSTKGERTTATPS